MGSHPSIAVAIMLIACLNLFWGLDTSRLEEWDETRRGVSAYEMLVSKNPSNFITPTYNGELDYWASKPPLGLWLISMSYRIFGTNRFALRLPAALCALGTIALLFFVGARRYSFQVGAAAALILSTTYPFLFDHAARNGEYDAPLSLLVTCIVFALELELPQVRYGILLGFISALIFLLKSFALLPVWLILALWWTVKGHRKYRLGFWLSYFLSCSLPILTWAVLRYRIDGWHFFLAMLDHDLLGRTLSAIEGHQKRTFWYFRRVLKEAIPWSIVFVIASLLLARQKNLEKWARKHFLFVGWFLVPLLVATLMKTKISWYVIPIYPAFAFLLALALDTLKARRTFHLLFVFTLMVAEARVLWRIHSLDQSRREEILLAEVPPGSVIASDAWSQIGLYRAKVELGLTILTLQEWNEFYESGAEFFLTRDPNVSLVVKKSCGQWMLFQKTP